MKTKNTKAGGARPGAGSKPKYSVTMKSVTIRVPDMPGYHILVKDFERELKARYIIQ